jgi:mannose/fructose/N-acetylgalactosamine-specific phosphotransferase system component IIC
MTNYLKISLFIIGFFILGFLITFLITISINIAPEIISMSIKGGLLSVGIGVIGIVFLPLFEMSKGEKNNETDNHD